MLSQLRLRIRPLEKTRSLSVTPADAGTAVIGVGVREPAQRFRMIELVQFILKSTTYMITHKYATSLMGHVRELNFLGLKKNLHLCL
jgi:hypothetical protein